MSCTIVHVSKKLSKGSEACKQIAWSIRWTRLRDSSPLIAVETVNARASDIGQTLNMSLCTVLMSAFDAMPAPQPARYCTWHTTVFIVNNRGVDTVDLLQLCWRQKIVSRWSLVDYEPHTRIQCQQHTILLDYSIIESLVCFTIKIYKY